MYQMHNENGAIQNLETGQVVSNFDSRRGRQYLAWAKDNEPLPMAEPQELVIDENEEKIQAELRKMAITNLGDELPADYK